jgi:hypothetical protein
MQWQQDSLIQTISNTALNQVRPRATEDRLDDRFDDAIQRQVDRLYKRVEMTLSEKCQVTLTPSNYDARRTTMFSNADLIGASHIFLNKEDESPSDDPLDRAIWEKKDEILRS